MKLDMIIASNVYYMHVHAHVGRYFEGQGHRMTLKQTRAGL